MAGYVKIWTTIESDGWFLGLSCLARGLWIQLIIAAKAGSETGQVWGKSWAQLGQRWGLSRETCAKNLRKFADAGKVSLQIEGNGTILITIHNYLLWQGIKGPKEAVELHRKRKKPCEKSHRIRHPQSSSEQNSSEQNNKTMSGKPDDVPYEEIITDLNSYQDNHYKYQTESIRKLIRGRWAEGYRLKDFQYVHAVKFSNWQAEKINGLPSLRYFRPKTLYSASNFPGYREEKFNHEYIANQFGGQELQNIKHIASWLKKKGGEVEGSGTKSVWPSSEKSVARIPERSE